MAEAEPVAEEATGGEAPAAAGGPDPEAQAELGATGRGRARLYRREVGAVAAPCPPPPAPAAPDVSNAEPAAALGSLVNLPPVRLEGALGGVGGAITNTVQKSSKRWPLTRR